jgi:hypothetical protein
MTTKKQDLSCSGYCNRCGAVHRLSAKPARKKAMELLELLEREQSIGFFTCSGEDQRFSTTPLFGKQRGKMFGVLECLDQCGSRSWLYAFSGQFNGEWLVDGWAPPLFDLQAFRQINDPVEKQIKTLGEKLRGLPAGSREHISAARRRRQLSRQLMTDIHDLYQLQNFTGERATLHEASILQGGKPSGTGDCCAPKLLHLAAINGLQPLSLAEFYFGRSNRSGTRKHGRFYAPCSDKCQPLLGFLLCGCKSGEDTVVNGSGHHP